MMATMQLRGPAYDLGGSCDSNSASCLETIAAVDRGPGRPHHGGRAGLQRRAIFLLCSAAERQMAGVRVRQCDAGFLFGREIRREKLKGP